MQWETAIRIAGVVHLGIAAGNLLLPRVLDAKRTMPGMDRAVKQVLIVHAGYIVAVLAMLGGLLIAFPERLLDGSAFARTCSALLALFWGARLVIQFAYYDRAMMRRHRVLAWPFTVFVAGFTALFALVALRSAP